MMRVAAFPALVPTGVADTVMSPIEPRTGAVTEKVAMPLDPVVTSVCDSAAPCGALAPSDSVMRWPTSGWPFASRAVIVTIDWDDPSRGS